MQIFINAPDEKIRLFNRVTEKAEFVNHGFNGEGTALVIEGPTFEDDLDQAVKLNVPVIVIAGLGYSGLIKAAREQGIPDKCIIIKENNDIKSIDGIVFGQSRQGISVFTIVDICKMALDMKLYPEEICVWTPVTITTEPNITQSIPAEVINENPELKQKPESVQTSNKKAAARIVQKDLIDLIDSANKIIAIFRTVPSANSGKPSFNISEELQGLHIEIAKAPGTYTFYNKDYENAVLTGRYGFVENNKVEISNLANPHHLIIEIADSEAIDAKLFELIYEHAKYIVHIPGSFDESKHSLENWISPGYNLTAIIPGQQEFTNFKGSFEKTMSVSAFLRIVKGE